MENIACFKYKHSLLYFKNSLSNRITAIDQVKDEGLDYSIAVEMERSSVKNKLLQWGHHTHWFTADGDLCVKGFRGLCDDSPVFDLNFLAEDVAMDWFGNGSESALVGKCF